MKQLSITRVLFDWFILAGSLFFNSMHHEQGMIQPRAFLWPAIFVTPLFLLSACDQSGGQRMNAQASQKSVEKTALRSGEKPAAADSSSGKPTAYLATFAATDAHLGIAIYPSATLIEGSERMFELNGALNLVAVYMAQDKPEKVIAFYRSQLQALYPGAAIQEKKDSIALAQAITLSAADPSGKPSTQVSITPKQEGAMISLLVSRAKP